MCCFEKHFFIIRGFEFKSDIRKKNSCFLFQYTMGFFAKVETFCCHVFFSTIDVFLALGHNFLLYVEACNRINTQFLGSLEL
jgi:hypothetical protein